MRVIRDIEPGTITPENFRSCVIKKVDGTASGGVYLCHSYEEYAAHVDDVAEGARQVARAMRADTFDIDCDFYLAGPPAFVDALGDELRAAGVPAAQIHAETP